MAEHAAAIKAKEAKLQESQQKAVIALDRDRGKHEWSLSIVMQQHITDLENPNRRSKREWQNVTDKLQEELGQQQTQFVLQQLQIARNEKGAKFRVETLRSELSELHVAVDVYSVHFVNGPFSFYDLNSFCFVLP
jgi:hypothetical protein